MAGDIAPATVRFASGELEVEVLPERGARLHRVRAYGHDVLRTPPSLATYDADPFFWGGYPMAPWCNRVAPGKVVVGERTIRLASNFPDGTSIHGLLVRRRWRRAADGSFRAGGQRGGWPWRYDARVSYAVAGSSLRAALSVTNRDDAPMPVGLGFHPWFRRPLEIEVPAAAVFARNSLEPVGPEPVTDRLDLRTLRLVPDGLDGTWAGPAGRISLRWPGLGIAARLTIESSTPYLAVASPPGLEAVAVEPQSHAPAGLARLAAGLPGGLELLEPGDSRTLGFELTFEVG
jgi:aldose 1-epimerase